MFRVCDRHDRTRPARESAASADAQTIVPLVETRREVAALAFFHANIGRDRSDVTGEPASLDVERLREQIAVADPEHISVSPSFDGAYRPLESDVTSRTGAVLPSTEAR